MLPNLPFLNCRITKADLPVCVGVVAIVGICFYGCVTFIKSYRELGEIKEILQKQMDTENCVGTHNTKACLDYRQAKLVINQDYLAKLAALRKQREEAENAVTH